MQAEVHDHSDIDKIMRGFDEFSTQALKSNKPVYIKYGTDRGMTSAQRGSLHVWCQMVADTLNDAGLPCVMDSILGKDSIEIDWTMQMIKDMQYKRLLKAMTGKVSSEHQNTVEPSKVAETIIRKYSEHGVVLPAWPSKR